MEYADEETCTEIGDNNSIRERVTIHRGTVKGEGVTKIGNENLFMVNSHVGHDCIIGDHCIMANNATLGGHVSLGDFAIISGMSAVHQFCRIGTHAMVGGCSGLTQDVPPYIICQGNHAKPYGINITGLKRRGYEKIPYWPSKMLTTCFIVKVTVLKKQKLK